MKNPARLGLGLLLSTLSAITLPAQSANESPPASAISIPERTENELDELLGPVALYPDDLIALILPAAVQGTDIVLAARYFAEGGKVTGVNEEPWDDSVRALAHFPDLIEWLNENLSWTQDLGDAFALQPAEVMKSVQRLRSRAYASGSLRTTPQQQVLVDGDVIRIVSAEENIVYVPRYEPEIVYVERPVRYVEPVITFGLGWHVGSWHRWDCDWRGNRIWVFNTYDYRHRHYWRHHHRHHWRDRDWYRDHGREWRPHRPHRHRPHVRDHDRDRDRGRDRPDRDVFRRSRTRPTPYVENHNPARQRDRDDRDRSRDRQVRAGNATPAAPAVSNPPRAPRNNSVFNRSRNSRAGNPEPDQARAGERTRRENPRGPQRSVQIPGAARPAQAPAVSPAPARSSAKITPAQRSDNNHRVYSRSRNLERASNSGTVRPHVAPPPRPQPAVQAPRPQQRSVATHQREARPAPQRAPSVSRPEAARSSSRPATVQRSHSSRSNASPAAQPAEARSAGGDKSRDAGNNNDNNRVFQRSRTR